VPDDFRFSVKLPKAVTHLAKLADCARTARRVHRPSGRPRRTSSRYCSSSFRRSWSSTRRSRRPSSATSIAAARREWPASRAMPAGLPTRPMRCFAELAVARVAADPAICDGRGAARRVAGPGLLAAARLACRVPLQLSRSDRSLCRCADERPRLCLRALVHLRQYRLICGRRRRARARSGDRAAQLSPPRAKPRNITFLEPDSARAH
jgi:hypothetical protein